MSWLESGGSALLGAAVGSFGSYLVQRRLGTIDHRRRLVIDYVQQLQQELHATTFLVGEFVAVARLGSPDQVRLSANRIIERASSTQMPKTVVATWHGKASRTVTSWENQILAFVMGTVEALDSGDSSTEMRLAYEFTQRRSEGDDFGLQDAINALSDALRAELGKQKQMP